MLLDTKIMVKIWKNLKNKRYVEDEMGIGNAVDGFI